jgi:hypothetical protein
MKIVSRWPKRPITWMDGRQLCVSVPFSWNMPSVRKMLRQRSTEWESALIGGPGVYLVLHYYPDFLEGLPYVKTGRSYPGVLQRANALATRTTEGCVHNCSFCGIGQGIIEPGGFWPLLDWPDLPIFCDNNLLAAPFGHFDRVIDRAKVHGWCDFEQGLDPCLLTEYHAIRIAEIAHPMVRLSLDSTLLRPAWERAYEGLRKAGVRQHDIRSYVLVGFESDPDDAWDRCKWIQHHGVKPLPMWYHELNTLKHNVVTERQGRFGWTDYERRRIMQFHYQHKEAVR